MKTFFFLLFSSGLALLLLTTAITVHCQGYTTTIEKNYANIYGLYARKSGDLLMAVPTLTSVKMKLANGTIANFAGTEGVLLDTGDGGLAVNTTLSPYLGGLTQLPNGDVLLQDGYRVRRVDGNGIITTFAGNGGKSHSGDGGLATLASIGQVSDLASDALGNVYIASYGQRIRKVDSSSGIISLLALAM